MKFNECVSLKSALECFDSNCDLLFNFLYGEFEIQKSIAKQQLEEVESLEDVNEVIERMGDVILTMRMALDHLSQAKMIHDLSNAIDDEDLLVKIKK